MYLRLKVGTIIFCFRNETLQISCIRLLPKWLGFKKIFPKSPKETAGSYCKCLQGHKGVTTCVCALCIIVLFCSNLGVWEHLWDERRAGESNYKTLVFTGKCRRPWRLHIWHHCDIARWRQPWTLLAPREKNTGDLGENAWFSLETPTQFNFTLH